MAEFPIKILILHNFYQQPGGEDLVVEQERAMLAGAGHEVHLHSVTNHDIGGFSDKLRLLWETAYNPASERMMDAMLAELRPDIVHVHNFFPLFTPAVHVAAARAGVGVVQTLHNYRLFCAAATFEREGRVCELCLHGSRLNALRHRCYRGSVPATAALVHMQNVNDRRQLLARHVHRFIALTDFARGKYVEGGLPADRIVVKANFLDRTVRSDGGAARSGGLFVGRLSPEKGVDRLIDAWRDLPDIPLRIAGDGPLRAEIERAAPPNVEFLGRVDAAAIEREMEAAAFLLVPSLWYEGLPMTIVEAFSMGLPVIASRLGSLQEIVSHECNGLQFAVGDRADLVGAARRLNDDPDFARQLGAQAQRDFADRYGKRRNLAELEAIYADAIATAKAHPIAA